MNNNIVLCFFLLITLTFSSCYSFKGITIPPAANTFFVEQFNVYPENIPPNEGQDFAELLKDKIRRESRLNYVDTDPNIEFTGSISEFEVTAEAPKDGEETSFNRLTIAVLVEYINNVDTELSWEKAKRFSFFYDYPSEENLLDVQDEYIDIIFAELTERVFNEAFTNW